MWDVQPSLPLLEHTWRKALVCTEKIINQFSHNMSLLSIASFEKMTWRIITTGLADFSTLIEERLVNIESQIQRSICKSLCLMLKSREWFFFKLLKAYSAIQMKCNKIKLVLIESVPKSVKAVQQQYHSLVLRDEIKTITKNLDLHLSSYHF